MSVSVLMVALALMVQTGPDETGVAVAKPTGKALLEHDSGSYFQVFEFFGRPPHTFRHAARMVKGYHYQGREGRLAHIKTGAIHYFLLLNFPEIQDKKMWIGLQAVCNETTDIGWLEGTSLSEQSFRAWNGGTARNISRTCKRYKESGKQLPVFYEAHELGVRWEVATETADIRHMIVEFPALEEEREESAEVEESSVTDAVVAPVINP